MHQARSNRTPTAVRDRGEAESLVAREVDSAALVTMGKRTRWAAWVGALVLVAASLSPSPADPAFSIRLAPSALRQGETAQVLIRTSVPLSTIRLSFQGRSWPLYHVRGEWRTYLATDPTTPHGRLPLLIEAVTARGERITIRRTVAVTKVSFPVRRLTFDPSKQPLLSPEVAEWEQQRVREALRILAPEPLWAGPFLIPVPGEVLSPYGVLNIYQGQVWGFHRGVDLAAEAGTPVRAGNHGIVRLAEALPLSGNAILLDHGLGVVTSYLHLSRISVSQGQRVKKGEIIGLVGSTGLATGPHLHWGMRVNGVHVDPLPWTR